MNSIIIIMFTVIFSPFILLGSASAFVLCAFLGGFKVTVDFLTKLLK